MTDITPLVPADRQFIQAYGDGGFKISERRYSGPVIVFPDRTIDWPVARIEDLSAESLHAVESAGEQVELLLIGCGRSIAPVPSAVRQAVRGWGAVVEPMDTGAACRTYNVLLTEGRRVAAALIPV